METRRRIAAAKAALCLACLASGALVLLWSLDFGALARFASDPPEMKSSSPTVHQLAVRKEATSSSELVGGASSPSAESAVGVRLSPRRNATAIRKTEKAREARKLELGLAQARAAIRKATKLGDCPSNCSGHGTSKSVYRNRRAFLQSYMEMERRFKVYVYSEGEPPIVHDGPCKDIYTIEGRFIQDMEHGSAAARFGTRNPRRAHAYFMPFSVTRMVTYLYKPPTYDVTPLRQFVADYVRAVSAKYPFWNRTRGADHFMVACHDWGPHASHGDPHLYKNSIRALCNANASEGFNPQKDVSLPEIHLVDGNISPKLLSPPPPHIPRPLLAFFAGGLHGPIRPLLLRHWKDKGDPDIRVYGYLPKHLDYYTLMLQSRFCLCPSGYEVASPRIVESVYAECVPVIISEHYVLPFSDVLNWDAFSIKVEVSAIPRLKEILQAIPEDEYRRLRQGLRAVRRHFVLNQPAKRFDVFHMVLHSIWLRRLNLDLG
ncbi:hypothetical protein BT93_C1119 [Corymbia citriodora subsp. variegata]|nr:hypothetical protein BT93_C1119 [Corymbia citriodora subsp. variegata]